MHSTLIEQIANLLKDFPVDNHLMRIAQDIFREVNTRLADQYKMSFPITESNLEKIVIEIQSSLLMLNMEDLEQLNEAKNLLAYWHQKRTIPQAQTQDPT